MLFHPHVHLLVTAGGLSPDQARWIPTKELELSGTVKALSVLFRAKMGAAFEEGRPPPGFSSTPILSRLTRDRNAQFVGAGSRE
jgi:hypothetical protein